MGRKPARPTLAALRRRLKAAAQPRLAAVAQSFFKTGPGEYGEGDRFLGMRMATQRSLAREFRNLPLASVERALESPWHEERMVAVLILVDQYRRGDAAAQERIYRLYLKRTDRINNWDLIDVTTPHIVGAHLAGRSRKVLDRLIRSRLVWERRIALLATFAFILRGEFDDTLRLAARVLDDPHDLIHKAAGWMLREVGKRGGQAELVRFLARHQRAMPRTMLRYAIERFPEATRRRYLAGVA